MRREIGNGKLNMGLESSREGNKIRQVENKGENERRRKKERGGESGCG